LSIKKICLAAILTAVAVIVNRFASITIPLMGVNFVKFGFTTVVLIATSFILGIKYGVMVAVLQDLISCLLVSQGVYNPGYTFDYLLIGLTAGLLGFLYQKKYINKKILFSIITGIVFIGFVGLSFYVAYSNEFKISSQTLVLSFPIKATIISILLAEMLFLIFISAYVTIKDNLLFLYVIAAFIICDLFITIPLAPLWNSIQTGIPYSVSFLTKFLTSIIQLPVKIQICYTILRLFQQIIVKKYRFFDEKPKKNEENNLI